MGWIFNKYGKLNDEKEVYVLRMLNVNGEAGNDLVFGVYLTREEARKSGFTLKRLERNTWPSFEVKRVSGFLSDTCFLRHFIEALIWNWSNAASLIEQIQATEFASPEDDKYFKSRASDAKEQIAEIKELLSAISATYHVDIDFPSIEEIAVFDNICDNLKINCSHAA